MNRLAAGPAMNDEPGLASRLAAGLIYYLPSLLVMLGLLVFCQLAVDSVFTNECNSKIKP